MPTPNTQELMELSRQAAGCLPEDVRDSLRCENEYRALGVTGYWECFREGYDISWNFWLHESTEACTEIMVRVLLKEHATLELNCHGKDIWFRGRPSASDYRDDPMLAFRVAVLRALIALKAKS